MSTDSARRVLIDFLASFQPEPPSRSRLRRYYSICRHESTVPHVDSALRFRSERLSSVRLRKPDAAWDPDRRLKPVGRFTTVRRIPSCANAGTSACAMPAGTPGWPPAKQLHIGAPTAGKAF